LEEWWNLVPDQSVFASGGRVSGDILNLGARHKNWAWVICYLAKPDTVRVRLEKLSGDKISAQWIDPRTGKRKPAGNISRNQAYKFTTPKGWEDALLLLK
jgi:hypothetical protein